MSDDGPSMEELRKGSTFGDRDDPNAASPYAEQEEDDPDDDSIREDPDRPDRRQGVRPGEPVDRVS